MKPKSKLLSEVITGYKKLSSKEGDLELPDDETNPENAEDLDDLELGDEGTAEATDELGDLELGGDEGGDELADLDLGGEEDTGEEDTGVMKDIESEVSQDPDRQGLIRTVPKAHLIYKREQSDGTFEELWIYNIGDMKSDMEVKQAILAGTDIPTNRTRSEDDQQEASTWSVGNAELLLIKGLPN